MYKIILYSFLVTSLSPTAAMAQSFSAGNFNAADEGEVVATCRADALTLNQRLITVRQVINTIIECNKNGEVYDSGTNTCRTPLLSPDHVFTPRATGDTIYLENADGSAGTDVVVGGLPGANIECEPAPVSPPVSPPPGPGPSASCTAPWGATVSHGSSVTAYQSASVTSPATCTSQTRTCNDGTLSGTYTNQNCSVTPAATSCRWNLIYIGNVRGMPSFDYWCGGGGAPGSNPGTTCPASQNTRTCARHDSSARETSTTTSGRVYQCRC